MKSTGKIGIIQNLEIRRSIIETYNSYETYKSIYEDNYLLQINKVFELVFDEQPELYNADNSNIIQLLQDQRVRNRFEGNFVVSINSELKRLARVNQKLVNELNEYTKSK